jgi:hypothetical protein
MVVARGVAVIKVCQRAHACRPWSPSREDPAQSLAKTHPHQPRGSITDAFEKGIDRPGAPLEHVGLAGIDLVPQIDGDSSQIVTSDEGVFERVETPLPRGLGARWRSASWLRIGERSQQHRGGCTNTLAPREPVANFEPRRYAAVHAVRMSYHVATPPLAPPPGGERRRNWYDGSVVMPSGCAALLLLLGLGRAFALEDDIDMRETAVAAQSVATDAVLVSNLEQVLREAPTTVTAKPPQWIRHRVRPRERVTQIAARYGVSASDLVEWNKLDSATVHPSGRRTLKVHARRIPPPRRKVRYTVGDEEGWMDVATKFGVERKDLRAYNWRVRRLKPGVELELWVDPGMPRTIEKTWSAASPSAARPLPLEISQTGQSIGLPQRGRIVDAVQLPESELYTRKHPGSLWGSSHTVEQILRAFDTLRRETGYEGEIVIGAMSRRHGRRFAPHASHQSGRDIDIRLPLLPGVPSTVRPNPDEVDWLATWALVKAFVDTGEVAVIFLDIDLQSRLYEAARSLGETPDTLRDIISWPNWKENTRPVVRHAKGHDGHIHVRITCGRAEPRCKGK